MKYGVVTYQFSTLIINGDSMFVSNFLQGIAYPALHARANDMH